MAWVNRGFLHYTDMKKFFRNLLLKNRWSDFEIILEESGFDISGRPDCPIRAVIATGKLPSAFVSPPGKKKVLVHYRQFGSLLQIPVSLRSDKQMDIKLFTEFLEKKKKKMIHKKHGFYGRLIFLLW